MNIGFRCITITGADDSTDIPAILDLSRRFPLVEWGILVGSADGRKRYPSVSWIRKLAAARAEVSFEVKLSLHVCGVHLRDLLSGYTRLPEMLGGPLAAFDRVQLNFHGERVLGHAAAFNLAKGLDRLDPACEKEIIFQEDGVNAGLEEDVKRRFRFSSLFDTSHGAGEVPEEWPKALSDRSCGWAGGLGPANLEKFLPEILDRAQPLLGWWVDMETAVRSDDDAILDLERVTKCLEIATKFAATKGAV